MDDSQKTIHHNIGDREVIVEIVPSAYKHGKSEADILAVLDYSIFDETLAVDPNKTLAVGFDTKGNLIEVIFHELSEEHIVVFHVMSCRKVYLDKVLKR